MTKISLTPRDNASVGGDEVGEDEILDSINMSVMCSSFFATILMSVRPSDVSFAGSVEDSTISLDSLVISDWTSDFCMTF